MLDHGAADNSETVIEVSVEILDYSIMTLQTKRNNLKYESPMLRTDALLALAVLLENFNKDTATEIR